MKYTATFSDGSTITRNSHREYGFAWMSSWTRLDGKRVTETGFSNTADNAAKAAKPGMPYGTWRGMSSNDRAKAYEQNAKFVETCDLHIEIVKVN